MNILFGSIMHVSMRGEGGGLRNLILAYKRQLKSLGHRVDLFDQWTPISYQEYDIFHVFSASLETRRLGLLMKQKGLRVAIFPMVDQTAPWPVIRMFNAAARWLPKLHANLSAAAELCNKADLVTVSSDAERDYCQKALGLNGNNVTVVPFGLEATNLRGDPDLFVRRYGLRDFVLTAGTFGAPRKNHLRLIKVAGELGVPLVCIGRILDTPYAERCKQEAEKYENVQVLGFVDREILLSAYAAADVYIQPSLTEGVGIAALEAGLAGAKVVATKNGALPYYCGPFAEYVNPVSEASIREKLLVTLRKPKDSELKHHLVSNFSWEKTRHSLVEAYESVL